MNIPSLTPVDERQFARLTRQESFTLPGQAQKMELIEYMLNERLRMQLESAEAELMQGGLIRKEQAERAAIQRIQPVHIQRQQVDADRFNLIVGKGSGASSRYTIMMPAHIDTVFPADVPFPTLRAPGWQAEIAARTRMLELLTDPHDADRKRGLGVWDMGAAVLNNIALAVDTVVPDGMQVYWVFTVDEEEDSAGALKLIREWPEWANIDLVLSSEIGPLSVTPEDGDDAMRYILARRGRFKMQGSIAIDRDMQGHGAVNGLPNAVEAYVDSMRAVREAFYKGAHGQISLQANHPLLGPEAFDMGPVQSDDPYGFTNPRLARFRYYIQLVPPSTLQRSLDHQRAIFAEISRRGDWARYGISYTLGLLSNETSYGPYTMPLDPQGQPLPHPAVDILQAGLREVSGQEPVAAGASSVSDETLYATAMLDGLRNPSFEGTKRGVLTVPIRGNRAHNHKEWVSWSDTARVRAAIRYLLEDPRGFQRLAQV